MSSTPHTSASQARHPVVGDIYELGSQGALGLVLFAQTGSEPSDVAVRVAPLYRDPAHLDLASHRDLVLPPEHTPFGAPVLVACWNARGLNGCALGRWVGAVDMGAVVAARTGELAGIIPNLDVAACRGWLGPVPRESVAVSRVAAFQMAEVHTWDALEYTAAQAGPTAATPRS